MLELSVYTRWVISVREEVPLHGLMIFFGSGKWVSCCGQRKQPLSPRKYLEGLCTEIHRVGLEMY